MGVIATQKHSYGTFGSRARLGTGHQVHGNGRPRPGPHDYDPLAGPKPPLRCFRSNRGLRWMRSYDEDVHLLRDVPALAGRRMRSRPFRQTSGVRVE